MVSVSVAMKISTNHSPHSQEELLARAETLAGRTLGSIAQELAEPVPADLRRKKGWVGELFEAYLGASAASRAEPDFPHLGIELKSLPVSQLGKPIESTFVSTIPLREMSETDFVNSRAMKKLARVLWVPYLGERSTQLSSRLVGTPFLWVPDEDQLARLQEDWEMFALYIAQGRISELSGHLGEVLQVRPKGAKGSSRRLAEDQEGIPYLEQPKGFYLRPSFTAELLRQHLLLPG